MSSTAVGKFHHGFCPEMLAVCVEDVEEGHLKKLDDQVQKHDEDGFFGSTEIKPQPLT